MRHNRSLLRRSRAQWQPPGDLPDAPEPIEAPPDSPPEETPLPPPELPERTPERPTPEPPGAPQPRDARREA